MANCFYKGKEVRSRSDRDRELQLSWAHTVTLIHTDINFRVTDSVATFLVATQAFQMLAGNSQQVYFHKNMQFLVTDLWLSIVPNRWNQTAVFGSKSIH